MKILGIETSCDETAVCLINFSGSLKKSDLKIDVLGNAIHSQIENHKKFGGVVPMMAKREHAKNLIPLFLKMMSSVIPAKAEIQSISPNTLDPRVRKDDKMLENIFGREVEFKNDFIEMIKNMSKMPFDIDAIAVTEGPGLEPALWMGIIFAQALSLVLNIPLIPVNHMEGHILSVIPTDIQFPAISLLISGGHTELILMKDWHSYEIIGETRDDAVGEAFDKVARMLGLPYPGGPEISKLSEISRNKSFSMGTTNYRLPRPMINSKDYDFSFSGLKTAVLYSLKNNPPSNEIIAKEFEDAVNEVLVSKTMRAIEEYNAKSLIIGGGVVSNKFIRKSFEEKLKNFSEVKLYIPDEHLRTDNALMIAIAGYEKYLHGFEKRELKANGTMRIN